MSITHEFLAANRNKKLRIAVLGDCMIDEFYEGRVKRVSPEAPVPVILSKDEKPALQMPGGAANVAYQFKNFNCDVTLYGIMDVDALTFFRNMGIRTQAILGPDIPRKKRFFDTQALLRWDVESDVEPEYVKHRKPLLNLFAKRYYDVVILSDYNKGLFSPAFTEEVIRLCNSKGIATIVDPKAEPIDKWKNCTIFKPNKDEVIKFTHGTHPHTWTADLGLRLNCQVVVTMSNGVLGFDRESIFSDTHKPVEKTTAIYGYSGAGDCFAATLAVAVGHGLKLADAAKLAYRAGARYVLKEHNSPISPLDLYEDKFVDPRDLRNQDFKLVFTNGCFDAGLTAAHVKYLQQAKTLGDKLVVALNSDDSVRRLKGEGRPIMCLQERMEIMAALSCVDFVVSFDFDTPRELIETIKPYIRCKGGDYKKEDLHKQDGVDVVVLDKFHAISTTEKLQKIQRIWAEDEL